jgi:hypothetical protein
MNVLTHGAKSGRSHTPRQGLVDALPLLRWKTSRPGQRRTGLPGKLPADGEVTEVEQMVGGAVDVYPGGTRVEGVESRTDVAEWALRPAVLWRKHSFGPDSERGTPFACGVIRRTGRLRTGRAAAVGTESTCRSADRE